MWSRVGLPSDAPALAGRPRRTAPGALYALAPPARDHPPRRVVHRRQQNEQMVGAARGWRGEPTGAGRDVPATRGFLLPVLYPRCRAVHTVSFQRRRKCSADALIDSVGAKPTSRSRAVREKPPGVHRGPEAAEGAGYRPAAPDCVQEAGAGVVVRIESDAGKTTVRDPHSGFHRYTTECGTAK